MKFLERGMKMLILSSYPPRECGIATFSKDIKNAIQSIFGSTLPIEVCALQNNNLFVKYSAEVTYVLNTNFVENYRLVAEKINARGDIGMVCIQHEFGLFGGDYGEYLLNFLVAINKPVLTVFHTVLPHPDSKRKKVVEAIVNLSKKIIVLTHTSKEILTTHYGFLPSKINVIPHGTHIVLWEQKQKLKNKYHFSDQIVMTTFGLLGENKSIETVLYALPDIVKKHPQVIYYVIGKTHPDLLKKNGETYRNFLHKIVQDFQLENHVIFINEYVELQQLLEYLTASDIYLFTSKDPNQAVSGTFAYALSCGCAVISTPIPHANEFLNGAGILLPGFANSDQFKEAILHLVTHQKERSTMGENAYRLTHATTWENCALSYGLLFGELTDKVEDLRFRLPVIKLDHFLELTTPFGMLQFSNFSKPDPNSGYTLDDNARALIAIIMYYKLYNDSQALELAKIYLRFIQDMQREDGFFDNYKNFDQQLTSQNSSENLDDANGRALWSLGYVIGQAESLPQEMVQLAKACWQKAQKNIITISSPRAIAYSIKGLYQYYTSYPDDTVKNTAEQLANKLLQHYNISAIENWYWYEDYMTYANNVLPEAMLYSYLLTGNKLHKEIAEISFDFLLSHYFMKGQLKVISNDGWFVKKNERTFLGEQPIEVATTITALDLFYEVTGNIKYRNQLEVAFSWFLGNNHLKQIMYNPINGGCYDGLEDTEININQGAESTVCFFKAQLIMEKHALEIPFNTTKDLGIMRQFAS